MGLDPIETAIRNALEKGDAEDKGFRERVYRKAFEALDRALQANPALTVEAAINRRKKLQAKIAEIETEFIPAVAPSPEPMADDPLDGPINLSLTAGDHAGDVPTGIAVDPAGPGGAPLHLRETGPGVQADPDPVRARRRRRRPVVWLFIAVTLLAALGLGGWFALDTGLFLSAEQRDTSVPNPPNTGTEDFIPENEEPPVLAGTVDPNRQWITIFEAESATSVSAPSDATAEAMSDESGKFLRIRSGATGAGVVFDVGQGVLERIAGKKATFDIAARADEEGQRTEMSVDCNFGELGDCGRKRYAVGYERADYLFEVTLPQTQPGAGGTIAIISDFTNAGRAVDIYEIKVSVSP
jgi:hypothetical protein